MPKWPRSQRSFSSLDSSVATAVSSFGMTILVAGSTSASLRVMPDERLYIPAPPSKTFTIW